MLSNPVEALADYLHEVGQPIFDLAAKTRWKAEALRQAEAEVARCRRELKQSRRLLMACVKRNYVISEIETADVMCNRNNGSPLRAP
jgi:hypothetical protein